jgi:hypothetical protein
LIKGLLGVRCLEARAWSINKSKALGVDGVGTNYNDDKTDQRNGISNDDDDSNNNNNNNNDAMSDQVTE